MKASTLDFVIEEGELPPQKRASIWDEIQAKLQEVNGNGWYKFLNCEDSRKASQRAQTIRNNCVALGLPFECKSRGEMVYVKRTEEPPTRTPRKARKK